MRIAGIGSRKTPENILKEMTSIGIWARESGITVTSGHAQGADWAFEVGAEKNCLCYLPWKNFNNHLPMVGKHVVVEGYRPKLEDMVRKFHPSADRLTKGAWHLMRRNVCLLLGLNFDRPVDAVVCWTTGTGGTQFTVNVAKAYDIPVYNMLNSDLNTAEKINEIFKKGT